MGIGIQRRLGLGRRGIRCDQSITALEPGQSEQLTQGPAPQPRTHLGRQKLRIVGVLVQRLDGRHVGIGQCQGVRPRCRRDLPTPGGAGSGQRAGSSPWFRRASSLHLDQRAPKLSSSFAANERESTKIGRILNDK